MSEYIIYGAGSIGKYVLNAIGKKRVFFFIDNNKGVSHTTVEDVVSYTYEEVKKELVQYKVIIAVSGIAFETIEKQLLSDGIKYISYTELQWDYMANTSNTIVDYELVKERACNWIKDNTIHKQGIRTTSMLNKAYPEVSGYYIPTLIAWDENELAIQYAKWLCSIQKEDGSWYDAEDIKPYVFDTAQIIRGLVAVYNQVPEVLEHIIKGCDWIIGHMDDNGRLRSPRENDFGDGNTFDEIIHIYCLKPLYDAGEVLGREDYKERAKDSIKYYLDNCNDKIMNFSLLSHFYAYVMEGLVDMGEVETVEKAMKNIENIQDADGAVGGYKHVDWVCSTGLFQLALVWYKLGDLERGNKAFDYACSLQNRSGGWFGSYIKRNVPSNKEQNTYFPLTEISWANKYFLDALSWKNKLVHNTKIG